MSFSSGDSGGSCETPFVSFEWKCVKPYFRGFSQELENQIKEELDGVMQKILAAAVDLCPKETGALASSISLESGTISAGDFAGYQIFAGSEDIINPKTGKPTSEYAMLVHDGHAMRDGTFWEGVPFLDEALLMFEEELESCVDRALTELNANTQE